MSVAWEATEAKSSSRDSGGISRQIDLSSRLETPNYHGKQGGAW